MNTLKRSFQIIEELKNEGSLIDSIRLNNSGFSDDEDDCEDDYKCLGNCFDRETGGRVFFARNPYNRYTAYTILEPDESGKRIERHLRCFRDFYDRDKMKERLEKYRKPAQFGDVANEETRVDESVRKGFDITLPNIQTLKFQKVL